MLSATLKLCLVTHPDFLSLDNYEHVIWHAIQGGVTSVQLRNKKGEPSQMHELAMTLLGFLRPLHVPLIINDDVDFAKTVGADGVHLGQSDRSPVAARQILGNDKIIGLSIETMDQLELANRLTCIDYIAASAVFSSQTKTDCKTIWGLDGLKKISKMSKHPVVAIGGITIGNVGDVMNAGACGVAVVSAIHENADPEKAARQLIREINKGGSHV